MADAIKQKLTPTQAKVMKWLAGGWGARVSHGSAVEINGERMCNLNTLEALERLGLVSKPEDGDYYWMATAAGRQFDGRL